MQQPKVFISNGNVTPQSQMKDQFFLIVGVLGALLTFLGQFYSPAQLYYIGGSLLLVITAIHFRLFFFIALEIILFAGHGAIFVGIGSKIQFAIPIMLCVQLLVFYYLSGQLTNLFILIGITGIALLSIGLTHENQVVFFCGSSAISIYAYSNAKKAPASLIWAVLNTSFAINAMIKLLRM